MKLLKQQRKTYAFLVANTSLNHKNIADLTDTQIGDILKLDQFQKKQ